MIDIDDFKEQILPRLIVAVALTPAFLLVWWFLKMMNEPTPQEIMNPISI